MPSPSLNALDAFDRRLVVGMGGLAVSNNQTVTLTTYSLGSCMGVTIYDPVARAGGLLHAMLPEAAINEARAAEQPAMFVDTGLAMLFRAAYELRLRKHRAQVCVVGGAKLLDEDGHFNIGRRNYTRLSQLLSEHGLAIAAQDVGGVVSRTLHLNLRTGAVRLRMSGKPDEIPLFGG